MLDVSGVAQINGVAIGNGGEPTLFSTNVAIGTNSLVSISGGIKNTTCGQLAMRDNTSGSYNVACGYYSFSNNLTGSNNSAFGYLTGYNNTDGSGNTFLGAYTDLSSNSICHYSTAIGYNAFIDASNQIVLGRETETTIIPGIGLAVGQRVVTPGYIFDIVGEALINGVTVGVGSGGHYTNTACGKEALYNDTTGNMNTACGYQALYNNTVSVGNSAFGFESLNNSTNSNYCVSVGYGAGSYINNGDYNTFLGTNAGASSVDGSYNTFLGSETTVIPDIPFFNSTALGYGAQITNNNQIVLGNASISLLSCATQTISALSDARDKKNIEPIPAGLNFINELNPVKFTWNMRDGGKMDIDEFGFIAQELKEAQVKSNITYPYLVNDNNPDRLLASYGTLIPAMVKAIQELNDKLEAQQAEQKEITAIFTKKINVLTDELQRLRLRGLSPP